MNFMAKLRVNHGPIDEAVADSLTKDEKVWLRSWNRHAEIPGEEAPEPDAEDSGDSDYEDQGVEELKEDLKSRGLPVSGNKAELIARLEEDDEDEDEDE